MRNRGKIKGKGGKMKKHLWEVDHPYYCEQGNYYSNRDDGTHSSSWGEFMQEFKDADFDMNLLFRWDWLPKERDGNNKPVWNDDIYYRDGELVVFWMGQRKGYYFWSVIDVCKADEPEVIKFLKPRLEHLMKLWEPIP